MSGSARWSAGVDVGGTFTDLAAVDEHGQVRVAKVPTTPGVQADGVMHALAAGALRGADVVRFAHGTTVVTNLLLERAGARVVLCATAGATDLLDLRRQDRAALYDLLRDHPPALVPHERRVAVHERAEPSGITRALTAADAAAAADLVATLRPDVVAVSLLHSYAHPGHERMLADALRVALPGVEIVLSSDVLPELREYERTATTTAEAYARPALARYVRDLADRLAASEFPAPSVMTSGGGTLTAAAAATRAASLALSGPAGGVVGASAALRAAGISDALTIDVGGTSADVGLVLDGQPLIESGGVVAGVPIALPRVLVETVSAGGGSIAWVDDGGALRVGPRSAGARPGPAAFGHGGTEPTVTDAHVVLGHLRARSLAGGVRIDAGAAHAAMERLASRLGAPSERVARAVLAAADAEMARALRRVSVERGVDPRSCALAAFGGGGPLHACALAEGLGMTRVLVPPHAGVLSALGLASAAERRESVRAVGLRADAGAGSLGTVCDALALAAGGDAGARREWWARVRYAGQGHEVEVPMAPGDDGATIADRFVSAYRARFGYALDDAMIEIVSARHAASGAPVEARIARTGPTEWNVDDRVDDGGAFEATVRGPATIVLPDATLLVRPGWTARALPTGGWLVERDA